MLKVVSLYFLFFYINLLYFVQHNLKLNLFLWLMLSLLLIYVLCIIWCSAVHKIVHYLGEVLEDERDKLKESLTVNGSK